MLRNPQDIQNEYVNICAQIGEAFTREKTFRELREKLEARLEDVNQERGMHAIVNDAFAKKAASDAEAAKKVAAESVPAETPKPLANDGERPALDAVAGEQPVQGG